MRLYYIMIESKSYNHKIREVLQKYNNDSRISLYKQYISEINTELEKSINNNTREKITSFKKILKEKQKSSQTELIKSLFGPNGTPKHKNKFSGISKNSKTSPYGYLTLETYKNMFPNGSFFQNQNELSKTITSLINKHEYNKRHL